MVEEAYTQIKLYRNYLRDTNASNLWRHIALGNGTDPGHWSTGNAWAAAGMLRVLGTIKNSQFAKSMKSEQTDLTNWVKEIHNAMYSHIVSKRPSFKWNFDTKFLHFSDLTTYSTTTPTTTQRLQTLPRQLSWPRLYTACPCSRTRIRTCLKRRRSAKLSSRRLRHRGVVQAQTQTHSRACNISPLTVGSRLWWTRCRLGCLASILLKVRYGFVHLRQSDLMEKNCRPSICRSDACGMEGLGRAGEQRRERGTGVFIKLAQHFSSGFVECVCRFAFQRVVGRKCP